METLEIQARARSTSHGARCAFVLGLTLLGCTGSIGEWKSDPSGSPSGAGVGPGGVGSGGVGSTGSGAGGSSGTTTGGTGGSGPNDVCTMTSPVPARMVRLSFDQVANTLRAALG